MRPGRRAEPRIVDPATHPRRYVSLVVAAEYLEVDRKTLEKLGIPTTPFGQRRKILVADLIAWEANARRHAP